MCLQIALWGSVLRYIAQNVTNFDQLSGDFEIIGALIGASGFSIFVYRG